MDERLYSLFLAELAAGRKAEAKVAVERFVSSFGDIEEKQLWTQHYLPSLPPGAIVRHELFESLIFPVLLSGYEKREPFSMLWLAKLAQNLYRAKRLHAQLSWVTDEELLKEAYALAPHSEEIQVALLEALIAKFCYLGHEWPSGILYAPHGVWQTQYWNLMEEVRLARTVDTTQKYVDNLTEFEQKVTLDRMRRIG